jgi:hypothetical protein
MKFATCHKDKPHKSRGLCNACYQRQLYSENPERYINYQKKFYSENAEEVKKKKRKYCRENRPKLRLAEKKYRVEHYNESLSRRRTWVNLNPERQLATAAKIRAKNSGITFDITFQDIYIPTQCLLLNIPLIRGVGKRTDNSPTLDRIDSAKGYTKDNIAVISYRANRIKNDATIDELELISKNLRNLIG